MSRTVWGVHRSLQCMQLILAPTPPLCDCLSWTQLKSIVSCVNPKTWSHSKCLALKKHTILKISCKARPTQTAQCPRRYYIHQHVWLATHHRRHSLQDLPRDDQSRRRTTPSTSRLIGQASPHQSQSEHSQCHRQKETVWEAFYPPPELLFGHSSRINQPLRLKRTQSETWQTYEEIKLVVTGTVLFFHP